MKMDSQFEFGIVFDFRLYRRILGSFQDRNARRRNLLVLKVPAEVTSIFDRVVLPRPLTAPHLWSHCALNKAIAVNCPGFNERRIPAVIYHLRLSAGVRHPPTDF